MLTKEIINNHLMLSTLSTFRDSPTIDFGHTQKGIIIFHFKQPISREAAECTYLKG